MHHELAQEVCPQCGGMGEIPHYGDEEYWGSDYMPCPKCSGDGYIEKVKIVPDEDDKKTHQ